MLDREQIQSRISAFRARYGVQDRDEAEIVSRAGQPACITVATNMAGRGTDIHLSDDVRAAGGLHVIGTEFHESARIDRQLAGRSARQGDPGSFEQLASFEDLILAEAWGSTVASELIASAQRGFETNYAISLFQRAQWDLEQRQRRQRTLLVETERRRQLRHHHRGGRPQRVLVEVVQRRDDPRDRRRLRSPAHRADSGLAGTVRR